MILTTLFNLAMIGLARKLQAIPSIQHALYTDDITVGCVTGSLREKEERLQAAACVIETYVRARGLQCASEKSEIIRVWRGKGNRNIPTDPALKLEIRLANDAVPEKTTIRVLRMWLQSNHCQHGLNLIKTATQQVARMIKRVATKRRG